MTIFPSNLTLIPRPSSSSRSSRPTRTRQRIQTEACQQLQDTHPKDLPPLYLKIINIIRFIWIHSPYLNTPEIIAGKPTMTSKCARVRNRAGGGGKIMFLWRRLRGKRERKRE